MSIERKERLTVLFSGLVVTILVRRYYGNRAAFRLFGGLCMAFLSQRIFLLKMKKRIGPEKSTSADYLTIWRATAGSILAGLIVAELKDERGFNGWSVFMLTLVGCTASDWLDGPIARRQGATKLGAVLDIEADSWLTLWSLATAVFRQVLPWWCLWPPVVRYLKPLKALRQNKLPAGGGSMLSRVTGVAQMTLVLTALMPLPEFRQRNKNLIHRFALLVNLANFISFIRDMM